MTSTVQSLNSVTLCNPMDCNTPGFPVLHSLLKFAQTHVRWIGDAIQPSHSVIPSPPAFNLSQHQGFFKWVSSSHKVAKVLRASSFNICLSNEYSGLISFRIDWFDLFAIQDILKSPPAPQFKSINSSGLSLLYGPTLIFTYAAAAAQSLQSCPTLFDPIDGSPPGSPVPEILQARILEWVAISFSNAWKWKGKVKSLSHVRLLATPWTAAHQALPSMGFSRQEYWSGVPWPSLIHTWPLKKTIALTRQTFVSKVISAF